MKEMSSAFHHHAASSVSRYTTWRREHSGDAPGGMQLISEASDSSEEPIELPPSTPVFRVPLTRLSALRERGEERALESTIRDAAYLLSQLPPSIEEKATPGVSPGQGTSLTWSKGLSVFCVEIEDGYSDAYVISDGKLMHINQELTPSVVRAYAEWVQGGK